MSNISDDLAAGSIVGMIFGLPIFIGIAILAIPVIIVACIIDVPALVLLQNLLVFAIAVFFVWLFSKHQIIENGIVGLIAGSAIHTYFKWHPVFCILVGVAVVGILFFISNIKIGFWIKTIPFSLIVTIMVYLAIYSTMGLFPVSDTIWEITFFIIFLLENIFIRCAIAVDNGVIFNGTPKRKAESYNYEEGYSYEESSSYEKPTNHEETRTEMTWFAGINSADELKKRYRDLMKIYHPDNQAGDTNAVQQIQQEYEQLLEGKFKNT